MRSVIAATTSGPVNVCWAWRWRRYRAWSSRKSRISTRVPSARCQWVMSDCQHSFGRSASKRTKELRGRFSGAGVMRPASWRMRRIVEIAGVCRPSSSRCQAMVAGPASAPVLVRSFRSCRIRCRTGVGVVLGRVCGARERGSRPAGPSVWYRVTRVWTHCRVMPYRVAASAWVRPCSRTARTMTRFFGFTPHRGVCDGQRCRDSRVNDHDGRGV